MTMESLTSLLVFALVATCTPGPNNIMLMASGMNYGIKRSLPHMLGIGLGFPSMVLVIGFGLAELFNRLPQSYTLLKVISAAYLLYLAWKIAMASPHAEKTEQDVAAIEPVSKPLTFFEAALFQWVNPKAWAMGVSAISLYAPKEAAHYGVLIVALAFLLASIPSTNLWTLLGQQLRKLLDDPIKRQLFNRGCAALLILSLIPMLWS